MEFKPQEIAKLVLGYLREQKCQTAFCEFLASSPYLKEHIANQRRGKYIVTRVNGLGLIDYLAEYALVYSIVQEHIEASDYYNERGLRTSLAQQLLYLLGTRSGIQTRTSTPIQDDFIINDNRENNINKSKSVTHPQNILEPIIDNSFDIISDEISATPIQSLPGNSSTELSFHNSSKSRSANALLNVNKSTDTEAEVDKEKSQEMCKEIFTQTFLENSDLIEKLADNINKEMLAKSSLLENPSSFNIGQDLDSTAIETIIQRIAKDPIVVNSIEEIMGSGEDESESHASPDRNMLNVQDKARLNTSKERALPSTPKKTQNIVSGLEPIRTRLRSFKKILPSPTEDPLSIEELNNEVVQSIVAASLSGERQSLDQESNISNTDTNTQSTSVGEVIISEQPYDNFIHTGTLAGPSNQIYVNTVNSGGLLMMQPSVSSTCSNVISGKSLQVDPMKPYYVIGNQPFGNVILPQTPFKLSNVITEQEIMAMPTIIVCDNNQQCTTTQTVIVPTSASSISTSQTHLRTIAPRKTAEKVQSLSEYISLYQCNDPSSPIISQPRLESSPPNLKSKIKTTPSTKINTNRVKHKTDKKAAQGPCKMQTHSETSTAENSNVLLNIAENAAASSKTESDSICSKISQEPTQNSSRNKLIGESMPQIGTPKMAIIQDVMERRSRSTPRNGSHVRQLDFSTPDKWGPKVRRANTSPKVDKNAENKETPVKAPKSGTLKSFRTSLFKSPDLEYPVEIPGLSTTANDDKENEQNKADPGSNAVNEITETSNPQTVKSAKRVNLSWDADLRALTAPTKVEEYISQKQKRKRSEESSKEHSSSKKPKENLNKTEEDASKIEIALGSTEDQSESAETIVTKSAQEDIKNVKSASTRRNRITTKKAMSASKVMKNGNEKQAKSPKIGISLPDNNCASVKISGVDDVTPKLENHQKVTSEEDPPEKQYAVINRHVKSRIKKKCNMESSIKKTQIVPEEIILTNITKIKSCEILDENINKLVLSPSKLNANKRTLVEMENRSPIETSAAAKGTNDDTPEVTDTKFITPELVKTSTNIPPLSAKRNIMPILETPVKFDSVIFPKTPSICSPPIIDTPFTKAVLDQLTGVDINAIPTPKFPITPNVPFTPAMGNEQSPFSNRATDYSTSSSYYQPSDTEQNKSLEQLLEECRKLDSQTVESSKEVDYEDTLTTFTCKNSQRVQISEKIEINELVNTSQSPEVTNMSITDKMKAFNHSMMGKKNLNLVKMFSNETEKDESSSSDSNSSTTETSSTSSSDDSDSSDSSNTDDDVKAPAKNVSPYLLRSRKGLKNSITPDLGVSKDAGESQNAGLNEEQHLAKIKEKSLSFQDGLLQEMEEKRQRTIARFKNATSTAKTKENSKQRKRPSNKTIESEKEPVKKDLKKTTTRKISTNKVNLKKTLKQNTVNKSSNNEPNNQSDPPKELKLPESENKNLMIPKQPIHQLNSNKTSFVLTKKAKAIVNDDKEIILHLSSDDENLEPSKMVEAVLLECSTSSASMGDENRVSHTQCTSNNDLVNSTTVNEQESQGALDQEAETWVKLKGLMQMGIHLIPNKPAKKLVMPSEETEQLGIQTKENICGKIDQPAKCGIEELLSHAPTKDFHRKPLEQELEKPVVLKHKIKNAEKAGTSIETIENLEKATISKTKNVEKPSTVKQKTENLKPAQVSKGKIENVENARESKQKPAKKENDNNKLNRSLEDGELVSDDDDNNDESAKKKIKFKKCKVENIKIIEPKRSSDSYRNNSGKEYRTQQDRLRDFKEFFKYRPHSERQSKEPSFASTSRKLQPKTFKLIKNKISDKNPKLQKTPRKITEIKPKNESTTSTEKQIDVNELDYQMQFDVKTYTEETYKITYDYSKKINRTLSDYNLDILTKKFSANVYIAEIDSEVEKFLTFTPFEFLLDISPKVAQKKESTRSDKSHISKEQIRNSKKPLNILYNQLIKAAVETPRPSPLEDLYAPESTSRDYKRVTEKIDRSKKSEKSEKIRSKPKSVKEKPSDEDQSHHKPLENTAKCKKIEEQDLPSSTNKSDLNPENLISSDNQATLESGDSAISKDQATKRLHQDLEQNLQVVDGVIMLNANNEKQEKEEVETNFEANDELMNYALVGSDRVEDSDDLLVTDNRKRKVMEEEGEKQQEEKKQKTKEFLRSIDVDSFLKQLHGEM